MQDSGPATTKSSRLSSIVKWSAIISLFGALAVIFSGYGYQWGWWGLIFGFRTLVPGGTALAVLGGLVSFIVYLRIKSSGEKVAGFAFIGLAITLIAAANFGYWYSEIQVGYPPIHDITTDTENPPKFMAVAPLRVDAPNPVEYPGEEVARTQHDFYSNLETRYTNLPYDEAYDRALKTARAMPWRLVAQSREEGRIEASHKLPWYGFIDDVVIRIDTTAEGSKIDMRSKSRVGRSDLGVNAKRIHEYFEQLKLD